MVLKGQILPDHMPLNKFVLTIIGLPPITFTTMSGMEIELETAVMPDRTVASGGNTKATEFTATLPMHHVVERLAIELWRKEAEGGFPTYKKAATLINQSISGLGIAAKSLIGVFPTKIKYPDLDMENEGELSTLEVTFSVDQVLPG